MSTDNAGDGLREAVAALSAEFARRQSRNAAHNGNVSCSVWGIAGAEVGRLVAEHPATPAEVECGCGCARDMHIGEIGCPCGLPDEPPSSPAQMECRYPCDCDQFPDEHCSCMEGHTSPAEPDAGDVALTEAEGSWFREECMVCLGGGCSKCEAVRDEVDRLLAAREREAAERAGERIAQAIESDRWLVSTAKAHAARIARAEARP